MSRIGKIAIPVPAGVDLKIDGSHVSIKGPKGTLTVDTVGRVKVALEGGKVHVSRFDDARQSRAYHGLYQRLIANSIAGVTKGFRKELEIQGVGYRAQMQGSKLVLSLGYSHPIEFQPPAGITITAPKLTEVVVEGA
ncbi:MAG: 50S ribosomal protein L6, partial [Candidatus Sumerlaeia bacterium]|nr:50S ribosomal protein L6 [Candidatus Sumerlaeia bacterium]